MNWTFDGVFVIFHAIYALFGSENGVLWRCSRAVLASL